MVSSEPASPGAISVVACLAVFLAQSGITLYLPALPAITAALNADGTFAGMTLTVFLLGMALAMLLWGRWCAEHGAWRVLTGTLLLYGTCSILITAAWDAGTFLLLRFLQGIAAGGVSVSARSLVRACFDGHRLTQALSLLSLCFVMTLGIAQFLGALLEATWGWRAGFLLCGVASVLSASGLVSLGRTNAAAAVAFSSRGIYLHLLKNPSFLRPVLAGGFGYAIIVVFSATAPGLFQQQFGWTSLDYGWLGWPISLAYLLGAMLAHRLSVGTDPKVLFRRGLGLLLAGGGLMAFASVMNTADPAALWLPYCVMLVGQGISFPLCQALASQQSEQGAQAVALIGLLHQVMAALAGGLVMLVQMGGNTMMGLVCLVLAGCGWGLGRR